jgi:hypothetical protein
MVHKRDFVKCSFCNGNLRNLIIDLYFHLLHTSRKMKLAFGIFISFQVQVLKLLFVSKHLMQNDWNSLDVLFAFFISRTFIRILPKMFSNNVMKS